MFSHRLLSCAVLLLHASDNIAWEQWDGDHVIKASKNTIIIVTPAVSFDLKLLSHLEAKDIYTTQFT